MTPNTLTLRKIVDKSLVFPLIQVLNNISSWRKWVTEHFQLYFRLWIWTLAPRSQWRWFTSRNLVVPRWVIFSSFYSTFFVFCVFLSFFFPVYTCTLFLFLRASWCVNARTITAANQNSCSSKQPTTHLVDALILFSNGDFFLFELYYIMMIDHDYPLNMFW